MYIDSLPMIAQYFVRDGKPLEQLERLVSPIAFGYHTPKDFRWGDHQEEGHPYSSQLLVQVHSHHFYAFAE